MREMIIAYDENTKANPIMGDWVGELVRCKNCVNRYDPIDCKMYSEGMDTSDDWFCADGIRKLVKYE